MKPIICFGEILWDIFPAGKKIGGAPFNVAYHLNKMGIDGRMISCVGNDELGKELIEKVKEASIPVDECQINNKYDTGTVIAEIDKNNEAHYTIVEPVAWDFIEWKQEYENLVKNSQGFVFGSLGSRNNLSKSTLIKLLEVAPYKIFDINLRPPYISQVSIIEFMKKADLVKMNKAELRLLLDWVGKEYTEEEEAIKYIRRCFSLDGLIVTKGSKGAVYCNQDQYIYSEAIQVEIKDTVGSGDSFLAGFLAKRAQGFSISDSIEEAIALGAFITNHIGACPVYDLEEFKKFKMNKNIKSTIIKEDQAKK
ncbi:carbohydrate kinase [Apibacter sp.]|uniref:carbohydrate kinase family protein n=1 Tax=Apibacter sp. TaxID=2023709 RepID=UPI0025E1538F|nr:carbohydrate kinase [Apibacter sp.]MCT6869062.1 carbohydrate kinase [Apibacter sp.]